MNKKGIFSPTLLIILILVLGYSYYVLVINEVKDFRFTKKIGGIQSEIIDLYQEAEKISFYIDQSAKQASYNAIYSLGGNGGFFGEGCGRSKEGYAIWVNKDRVKCYPFEFERDFMLYFKNHLMELFNLYPERELLIDSYEIVFKDGFVNGSVKNPFNLTKGEFVEDNSLDRIVYSFEPSFKVEVNYDFSDFKIIKNKVNALISLCRTSDCFKSRMEKDDFIWEIRDSDNHVLFDVGTNKKLFHKPVVIRFALEYTK